jgi:hypothetical protein
MPCSFNIAATADLSSSIFAGVAIGFASREHAAIASIATADTTVALAKNICRQLLVVRRERKFCFTWETRSIRVR